MRAKKRLFALFVSTWALAQTGQLQPDADGVYPTDLNGIKPARLIGAVPASIPEDPRLDGMKHVCALWVTIGSDGTPKKIEVLNKIKTPFDDAAVAAVRQSHFKAGSYQGTAVATRLLLYVPFFFGSRQPFLPEVGAWDRRRNMTPPLALFTPEAELTDEARAKQATGSVLIHTLVSEEGLPTDLHVVQPLGYGLDQKAIEAVGRYRFSPATLGGVPVPMTLDVRVDYTITRYRK